MNWTNILVPIIVAIVAVIPGILALLKQRRLDDASTKKAEVDMSKVVQEVYQELLTDIKTQADGCKKQINDMSEKVEEVIVQNKELIKTNTVLVLEIEELRNGIKILVQQLIKLGVDPDFRLEE